MTHPLNYPHGNSKGTLLRLASAKSVTRLYHFGISITISEATAALVKLCPMRSLEIRVGDNSAALAGVSMYIFLLFVISLQNSLVSFRNLGSTFIPVISSAFSN